MPTKYSDIITYLDAIASNANNDVGQAPHHYWWHVNHDMTQPPLAYDDFTSGTVYKIGVPIINTATPLQSTFYLLLSTPGGVGGYRQMPDGGFTDPNNPNGAPVYLTDASCQIQLADGSIAGTQILAAMQDWLSNGYPQ
jgi:hypothetical protein